MGRWKEECAIITSLFFSVGCIITFLVLLLEKVDGHKHISWYEVFIPVWIGLLLGSFWLFWLFVVFLDSRSSRYGAVMWLVFSEVSFAVFLILLAIRLENPELLNNCYWAMVFIPLWFTLQLLLLIDKDWPGFSAKYQPDYEDGFEKLIKTFPINFLMCFAAFTILLVIRLDVVHDLSWYIIFIPWWYLVFVFVSVFYVGYVEEGSDDIFWFCLYGVLPLIIYLSFLLPLQFYLAGSFHMLTYVFIPLIVITAVLVIATCGLCCVYICH